MTTCEIFQGNQIGGCVCIITSENDGEIHRIMIDYGESLPGSDNTNPFNYPWDEKPIDAVFFTHNHMDHIGRIMEIPKNIPLYMGEVARQVMINMQYYLSKARDEQGLIHKAELELLKDDSRFHTFTPDSDKKISLPFFSIEPYRVCHSAYDSYMFLIEARDDTKPNGKKVILHTGDFRGHGRIGSTMIPTINEKVHKDGRLVDVLITEGTMMSRMTENVKTEDDMMEEAAIYLREHKYAFLVCASTNLDSLASFYQAAQKASDGRGRYCYVYNNYYLTQLRYFTKVAGKESKTYKFDNLYKLDLDKELKSSKWKNSMSQKELMERTGFLAIIKPEEWCEKYVTPFIDDYESGKIKEKPVIIYSMWDGYLRDDEANTAKIRTWIEFVNKMQSRGIEIKHLHTSGHAVPSMICEVIKAVNPVEEIIPLHTEHPEMFTKLDISDDLKSKVRSY